MPAFSGHRRPDFSVSAGRFAVVEEGVIRQTGAKGFYKVSVSEER